LEDINSLAHNSPGFVWGLQTEDGDATGIQEAYHFHTARRQVDYWWPFIERNISFYLSRPGGRAWWHSQGRDMLDKKFVAFVDRQLEG